MILYNTLTNSDINFNILALINKQYRNDGGTSMKKYRKKVDRSFTPSKAKNNKNRRNKIKRNHK